ncbi:hypothetical protein M422DRAFT_76712 [Sphaerobolus stellatus SS14]|uniref:FAD-binding domain-containing protein n=1 Tax=Sphaerobolus stellatus (strain SS14) TaxID=990650 RepID=A0A0C9U6R6_SPHS4|nr:hypothetical protein M422DRAFT_76712 [Sphaerobolus stellatus SS14]
MATTSHSQPRIAIIGGGPGGLILGRLLQYNQLGFTIFERESPRSARQLQGGSLDIHAESGQEALRQAGLHDTFKLHMRVEGAALRVINKRADVLFSDEGRGEEDTRPEIDRHVLRDILLDSIEPSSIHWGEKVVKVEPVADQANKFQISFADGTTESGFDLVVGADGAWSNIRPFLTDIKPSHSGTIMVEGRIADVDTCYPEISKVVGHGSAFALGDRKGLLCQRNGDGSIRTYVMLRAQETWAKDCGIDWVKKDAKEILIEAEFGDWDQRNKDLLLKANEELIPRPLYMLPIGIKWESCPGVTLIGDAAHLMTPFAGVGVNLAMNDALDLANAIKSFVDDAQSAPLGEYQRKFEEKMLERARKFAQESWNIVREWHFSFCFH